METLFLKLANISITAGWLVLAVLLLRFVFRRAPKWICCLLWGLVALRLVCPLSIESALSLIPSAETLPPDILYTAEPKIQSGIGVIDHFVNPVLSASLSPAPGASANPTQIWSYMLAWIWAVGLAAMLLYELLSYLLLRRRVATATLLRENIKQSERAHSPFVLGLFRPLIYLPYGLADEDLRYVIAHEQAHIRRKDHWWKALGFVLLAVYWFNPLLWVAYGLLCRDIEAACDEKVIREMEKEDRRAYSAALLHCSVRHRALAACPLAFGETDVKGRVKGIMNYKKPALWIVPLAVAATAIAAVCLLTVPKGEVQKQPEPGIPASSGSLAPDSGDAPSPGDPADLSQPGVSASGIAFLRGMGCDDPSCAAPSHHHDCPPDCADYDHYHTCASGCTEPSHHHAGQISVSGSGGGHKSGHHDDGHH